MAWNIPPINIIDGDDNEKHRCILVRIPDSNGKFMLVHDDGSPANAYTESLDYHCEGCVSKPDLKMLSENFSQISGVSKDWHLEISGEVVATRYYEEED